MKHIMQLIWLTTVFLLIIACSETGVEPKPEDDKTDPEPSKLELLAKNWKIDSAYHAGVYDQSSTGKTIWFKKNGTYFFADYLNGSWYFTMDSTHMILDEGLSYEQDWTIDVLTEDRFVAKFKSPFTRQNAVWIMHPM